MPTENDRILHIFREHEVQTEFDTTPRYTEPIVDQQQIAQVKNILLTTLKEIPPHHPFPLSKILSILKILNPSPVYTPAEVGTLLLDKMTATPQEDYYLYLDQTGIGDFVLMFYLLQIGERENDSYPHADPTRWYTMNMQGRYSRLFVDSIHGTEPFPLPYRDDPLPEEDDETQPVADSGAAPGEGDDSAVEDQNR